MKKSAKVFLTALMVLSVLFASPLFAGGAKE